MKVWRVNAHSRRGRTSYFTRCIKGASIISVQSSEYIRKRNMTVIALMTNNQRREASSARAVGDLRGKRCRVPLRDRCGGQFFSRLNYHIIKKLTAFTQNINSNHVMVDAD